LEDKYSTVQGSASYGSKNALSFSGRLISTWATYSDGDDKLKYFGAGILGEGAISTALNICKISRYGSFQKEISSQRAVIVKLEDPGKDRGERKFESGG